MRRSVAALLFVLGLAAAAQAQPNDKPVDPALARGFEDRLRVIGMAPAQFPERAAVQREMVARYAAEYGEANPATVRAMTGLGWTLYNDGKHPEAAVVLERALRLIDANPAHEPAFVAQTLYFLAVNADAGGRLAVAEGYWRRMFAVDDRRGAILSPSIGGLIANLDRQSRGKDAEAFLRSQVEARRKAGRANDETAMMLGQRLFQTEGRERDAEPYLRLALSERERLFGPNDRRVAQAAVALGEDLTYIGRPKEAEPLDRRSLAIFEATDGKDSVTAGEASENLAYALKDQRRFAESAEAYVRAADIYEQRLGFRHPRTISAVNDAGTALLLAGRRDEGERRLRRAEAASRAQNGEDHVSTARVRMTLGFLVSTKDEREATRLLQLALPVLERDLGPRSDESVVARQALKAVLAQQGLAVRDRGSKAATPPAAASFEANLALFKSCLDDSEVPSGELARAISRLEADGLPREFLAACRTKLGLTYAEEGDFAAAETTLVRAEAEMKALMGEGAPQLDAIAAARAVGANRMGRYQLAADLFRGGCGGVENWRSERARAAGLGAEASMLRDMTIGCGGERARNLWRLRKAAPATGSSDALRAEAFLAAQRGVQSKTSEAMARASALIAASRSGLGPLVEAYETALGQRDGLEQQVADSVLDPSIGGDSRRALTARRDAAEAEVVRLGGRIRADQPLYWDLLSPEPLPLAALQGAGKAILGPNEALVLWMVDDSAERGLVFAASRESSAWAEIRLEGRQIEQIVQALRAQIDPRAYGVTPGLGPAKPAFDRAAAHRLHDALLGDPAIAAVIGPKPNLIIVPSGSLVSFPPGLLVASPPAGGRDGDSQAEALRRTDWLLRTKALSVLPSVASLRTLRELLPAPKAATDPLMVFADPDFAGTDAPPPSPKARQRAVRALASYYQDGRPAHEQLKRLERLPGTLVEGQALLRALAASRSSLLTGASASEAALREGAADGRLARARVLAFATHGLLAGDVTGLAEPALVLAAPRLPADGSDGLLTASEAAALRLNADWVVLSACNTAAPEAPGAEGLSGLARAFFHAGARSLLVSHWRLYDAPTAELIEGLFRRTQGGTGKAEALRQAALELLDNRTFDDAEVSYAHPSVWAPFVVVGEGR
jgi:CHAT domain-containing protein/tetratricopeptide (TPR) repeat protein